MFSAALVNLLKKTADSQSAEVYKEKLATKAQALKREYEIKKWSREKKIKILKLNF